MFLKKIFVFLFAGRTRSIRKGKLVIDWSSSVTKNSEFEGQNCIKRHSLFDGKMGYGSYIGPNCEISANIGRFTSIAPHVVTNCGVHPYTSPFVTTSPFFFSLANYNGLYFARKQKFLDFRSLPEIGNDCWIGQGCFIAGGVKIDDGAVVLAGAYVVKDVPAYAIVGGVPAHIIKYRYDEETIAFLKKVKWWNKDIIWLKENWELLCDIDAFKNYFNKDNNV